MQARQAPPADSTMVASDGKPTEIVAKGPATSLWPLGTRTELSVFISEHDTLDPWQNIDKRVVKEQNIVFGNWNEHRIVETSVEIPETAQHNGTLYAHIFWGKSGWTDVTRSLHDVDNVLYRRKLLTRYMPKKKEAKLKKLMGREKDNKTDVIQPDAPIIASYWYPNLTLCIVGENSPVQKSVFPAPVARHIHLVGEGRFYTPIFFINDFWMLGDKLVLINDTTKYVMIWVADHGQHVAAED